MASLSLLPGPLSGRQTLPFSLDTGTPGNSHVIFPVVFLALCNSRSYSFYYAIASPCSLPLISTWLLPHFAQIQLDLTFSKVGVGISLGSEVFLIPAFE